MEIAASWSLPVTRNGRNRRTLPYRLGAYSSVSWVISNGTSIGGVGTCPGTSTGKSFRDDIIHSTRGPRAFDGYRYSREYVCLHTTVSTETLEILRGASYFITSVPPSLSRDEHPRGWFLSTHGNWLKNKNIWACPCVRKLTHKLDLF